MLNTQENKCKIEGILSEIDLNYGSFNKDGKSMKSVGGNIKVRVDQVLPSGEEQSLEIPVYMFASEMTNKGTKNPAFESIERVMNEFVSIAASNIDQADRVRITNGQIRMNEYYGKNGNLVSFPRISASFVNKIGKTECKPEATFSVIFCVGEAGFEVDKDGVENPHCYKINAAIPQFGGSVDIVPFVATSDGVINAVKTYWNKGDTVKANGRLNFTSKVEQHKVDVDFGEPQVETRTINVSELVITGGSQSPLEGEFALDSADVAEGLKKRQAKLADLKAKSEKKATTAKATNTAAFNDLGF